MGNGALSVSPKVSAAALAGALTTVAGCVLEANHIIVPAGTVAGAVVLIMSVIGYLAPHGANNTTTTTERTVTKGPSS